MKKQLFIFAAALALVGCSNSSYDGNQDPFQKVTDEDSAIVFSFGKSNNWKGAPMRRASIYGTEAAALLGNNFIVEGTKGTLPASTTTTDVVFDNYLVVFEANTAGETESNTNDWDYVGKELTGSTQVSTTVWGALHAGADDAKAQTIKYWDYSADQYDFVAYSTGTKEMITTGDPSATQVLVSKIAADTKAYTFKATSAAALSSVYVSDIVTVEKPNYGNPVQIKFKNLTAKVRMAIYETVPGYSVRDVEFYTDETAITPAVYTDITSTLTEGDALTNYYYLSNGNYYKASGVYANTGTYYELTSAAVLPSTTSNATLFTPAGSGFATSGTLSVTYPHVGTSNRDIASRPEDYNMAQVAVTTAGTTSTTQNFTALATGTMEDAQSNEPTGTVYLGRTSNDPTFAGAAADDYYQAVIPSTTGQTLTLRCNYTLVSTDGSDEEIKVWGAKAIVPATFTKWQPNYAYTYIFKISDKSNGSTEGLGGKEELLPITFDAVVEQVIDVTDEQTTITTVATPSITTYQKDHKYADTDSYLASKGLIYVLVQNDNGVPANDLNSKGALYTVEATGNAEISEATVTDALIKTVTGTATVNGRNGINLTTATVNHGSSYVGVDGNTVVVASNSVDNFTPAAGTYAYVYTVTASTKTVPMFPQVPVVTTTGSETDVTGLKKLAWSAIASEAEIDAEETADEDYLYFQVLEDGAGSVINYSPISVVPGVTVIAANVGIKKILKSTLTACAAAEKAVASTFYFDTYNENNGKYAVKVINVQ